MVFPYQLDCAWMLQFLAAGGREGNSRKKGRKMPQKICIASFLRRIFFWRGMTVADSENIPGEAYLLGGVRNFSAVRPKRCMSF